MYPQIVEMNENESSKYLRMLELDAFANMLSAFRAQGPPTSEKLKLLKDVGMALRISQERCKAEIRKVILDERLNTIAYFSCGQVETSDDWIKEADEVAEASASEQFTPAHAERKRLTPSLQVQSYECGKSQQFRVPDLMFKSEENKKRKLSFGVENNVLSPHLIGPSKVSSVQQLYRQRMKAKAKEQLKVKQEHDQFDYKQMGSNRILQHLQQRIQKVPVPVQSSPSSSSPKINILQNISLHPYVKVEDTTEKIQNDVEDYEAQKNLEENNPPIQAGCSNENQAPPKHHQQQQQQQQAKQTILNIKPNNIMYKHVASPGPSSDIQKSLKICTNPRKGVTTKTVPGQKLIIVSNAQTIATTSILQRTLTIPFVKNISVKNFDKFKIVSTSTNTSSIQLTSLTNSNAFTTNSAKHKVLTVRTNPTTKKIIPLAHFQALNTKGNIKMVPVSGKLLTKTHPVSSPSPVYIMNNSSNLQQALTKSTSSMSVVMTCRPQESSEVETSLQNMAEDETVEVHENAIQEVIDEESSEIIETINNEKVVELTDNDNTTRLVGLSNQLNNEENVDDIESKISQLTAIPYPHSEEVHVNNELTMQEVEHDYEVEQHSEHADSQEEIEENYNGSTYILLGKDEDTKRLLKDLKSDENSSDVYQQLDSNNSDYKTETNIGAESNDLSNTKAFMVDVQNSMVISDLNAVN